ncbi:putative nuclear pore complex protein [Podospora didyma]|uniref:Nuclear pore complex protein n=1 Tax=Podospora didyma TaxID=330526 RepID=A0AAE0NXQ2_9PEZI|nr:putative nuclear pore complex protein [Podospora didyma]
MNPQTPMRPVPGAYFNTPAPGGATVPRRNLNFGPGAASGIGGTSTSGAVGGGIAPLSMRGGGGGGGGGPLASRSGATNPPPPVKQAADCINETLQLDESFPDLDSYCRPGASSDYDLQSYDSSWAPFHKVQMYPIPDEVFRRVDQGTVQTRLGLFANLNYAWASIDSSLFLWDYTHPNPELIGYEDATHPITAVALVPPKPGVFVKTITHILVVATTADIILLGLSATSAPSGSKTVTLYQTKMAVNRGSAEVSIIVGTQSGRIFFGGANDTDIYELFYQQEERWFSSRCGKINHTHPGWTSVVPILPGPIDFFGSRETEHLVNIVVDDTRNLVYSLSNKSTIRTYHMETPEKLTKVIDKSKVDCLRDVTHMVLQRSDLLNDNIQIVSLSPIAATEASKLHLMALTNTGCRLFLSATSSAQYITGASSSLAPQSMQVQFVKFPPKEAGARARAPVPGSDVLDVASRALTTSTSGLRFAPGYFFDIVNKPGSPSVDYLFVSTPDTGRIKATGPASALKYFEQGNWIELGGRACDIGLTTSSFAAAKQPLGFGNELAVQFDQLPSEFTVLTNSGVHVIRRRRLVDIFATTVRSAIGDEGLEKELRKFINQYGRVETISAALAVACGQGNDLRTGTSRAVDQATEDRARAAFIDYGGQPRLAETDGSQLTTTTPVKLSSRHDALALYLTRLVRKLWKSKVISAKTDAKKGILSVTSTINTENLVTVQENVERLRRFLEANKGMIQGLAGPSDRMASKQEELALQKEHQALHSLRKLMESVSEGISFVLMLFDERVTDIYIRLDDTTKRQLDDLTYENLFSQAPGKELAKVLVKAIVNRNIASGANVETVADALRRRCGSFCSPDDVVIFKAQEQLQRASEQAHNANVLRTLLAESLRLFEQVAGSLTSANLRSAVEQYLDLKYYAGAIKLCLTVASQRDRGNTAFQWLQEGKPANDDRKRAFDKRKECYDLIHEVLDRLEATSGAEPDYVDGRLTLTATKRLEAYDVVNKSNDEVFHHNLYDWYISKSWTDRILSIESPHVITYLQSLAATKFTHAELLYRYFTHRQRFLEAAQVQAELAKSNFQLSIKDRITLLSRAKANAQVNSGGISNQDRTRLLHEVSELLEIAHIQDDLLERLSSDPRLDEAKLAEIADDLNGPVQGLTELFNNYADQAGYFDICLVIYYAGDYQNMRTIVETWSNLIDNIHNEITDRRLLWEQNQAGMLPPGSTAPDEELPRPYEVIATNIQNIAHRTSTDANVFPIDQLLPLICAYAINESQDESIGADPCWPVLVFLGLGFNPSLIVRTLENMLDSQEAPFQGRRRQVVVQWIKEAIDVWVRDVERRGTVSKGGDNTINVWVSELLNRADEALQQIAAGRNVPNVADLQRLSQATRSLKRKVDNILLAEHQGGLRFNVY